jgi:hypothetical protein
MHQSAGNLSACKLCAAATTPKENTVVLQIYDAQPMTYFNTGAPSF